MSVLFWILAAHALACSAYLCLLAFLAFGFVPKTRRAAQPENLLVVVPAHNEEAGVAATVRALLANDYPKDRFEVWVVADNCSDATAERARQAGARVAVRDAPADPGKGQALDWFLRQRPETLGQAWAVVFLDADTSPDRRFLVEMASSLADGDTRVVQGYYGVRNPQESWRTGLMEVALALAHHLRPAGRERLGGTAGLKGNGMAFRSDLLARTGWSARGVVEDLEFSLDLLLEGVNVRYNPRAEVLAEMAATGSQAVSQRKRWEGGRFSLAARRIPGLLASRKASWRARLDAVLDLATPPLALLGFELLLLWVLSVWVEPVAWPLFPAAIFALGLVTACALVQRREPARVWLRLLAAPGYVAWKLWVYVTMLFTRNAGWVRTRRSNEPR